MYILLSSLNLLFIKIIFLNNNNVAEDSYFESTTVLSRQCSQSEDLLALDWVIQAPLNPRP